MFDSSVRRFIFVLICILGILPATASKKGAERILAQYEAEIRHWKAVLKISKTEEALIKAQQLRPNGKNTAIRLIAQLRGSDREEWILPYFAWIYANAPDLKLAAKRQIRQVFQKHHLRSTGAGAVAVSLAYFPDEGNSLPVAEAVLEKNPDKLERGQAALGVSLLLEHLGDDPRILSRRLKLLKQAIIDSVDMSVGDATVGDVAAESLYVIKNLKKGSVAPLVSGQDSSRRPFALRDYRGKVVVLTFWSQNDPDSVRALELLTQLHDKLGGENFALLGVNLDRYEDLRRMKADGVCPWRNFSDEKGNIAHAYRIKSTPHCFVLDEKGVIQYLGSPGSFVELSARGLLEDGVN